MGKGNLFLGTARGKVGDVVMYRSGGQQISRVRVRKIGNPRTHSQAVNRALLNTLSTAYSYMSSICDHAFQNDESKMQNYRTFQRLNQAVARATGSVAVDGTDTGFNFNFKGESTLRPNPYIISRGTLPTITPVMAASDSVTSDSQPYNFYVEELLGVSNLTYAQLAERLGVEPGSQVTFCVIAPPANDDLYPVAYGNFYYARMILADAQGLTDTRIFDELSGDGTLHFTNPHPKTSSNLTLEVVEGDTYVVVSNVKFALAGGVIVSNYNNGKWKRSNCQMVVTPGYESSNTMSEVYNSYMTDATPPASDLYLDQGSGEEDNTTSITNGMVVITTAGNSTLDMVDAPANISDTEFSPSTTNYPSDYYIVAATPIPLIADSARTSDAQAVAGGSNQALGILSQWNIRGGAAADLTTTHEWQSKTLNLYLWRVNKETGLDLTLTRQNNTKVTCELQGMS